MKEKINSGKTKIIYRLENNEVEIESMAQLTAGDGEKKDHLVGKDILANNTTCNIFELPRIKMMGTHFKSRMTEKSFKAIECKMIPLEVVIRRIATGSYLKRNPEVKEGTIFDSPLVEFFYKDDKPEKELRDPFVGDDRRIPDGNINLYKPKEKESTGSFIKAIKSPCPEEEFDWIEIVAEEVFLAIEEAFYNVKIPEGLKNLTKAPIILKDLKIEFGRDSYGRLIVADVIDNDSWRIEDTNGVELSKEAYRQGADLKTVKHNYEIVSEVTNAFKNL